MNAIPTTSTRPLVMGILNVTPDSFSDGGVHFAKEKAIESGIKMAEEGADILDVGGESTRPGSDPVTLEEELRRVLPVVEVLAGRGLPVSIDTMKPEVACAALDAGASIVNDVSGLGNPAMVQAIAEAQCTVCIMHMQGLPKTMQANPFYADVVTEVKEFLLARACAAEQAGVSREKIWIDPGIGFGKTTEHNLQLLRNLGVFVETGYPVLLGVSRKAFIGRILGSHEQPLPVEFRLEGTLAVQVLAQAAGVRIIRTHDVLPARRAIDLAASVLGEPQAVRS